MKKFFFVLAHLVLLGVFLALVNPFALFFLGAFTKLHTHWFVSQTATGGLHYFVPVGLIVITGIYLIILAFETSMRRKTAVVWTSAVWVLGAVAAFLFGWVTTGS